MISCKPTQEIDFFVVVARLGYSHRFVKYIQVSLFAELFNEMLMRDYGFEIYKALMKAPEKKEEEKKEKRSADDKSSKVQIDVNDDLSYNSCMFIVQGII